MTTATSYMTASSVVRAKVDALLSIPVIHDNAPTKVEKENTLHARASVVFVEATLIEISPKRYRHSCLLSLEFKAPVMSGDAAVLAQCDIIRSNFSSTTVDGVTYLTPRVDRSGEQNGWYRVFMDCPFYFET